MKEASASFLPVVAYPSANAPHSAPSLLGVPVVEALGKQSALPWCSP